MRAQRCALLYRLLQRCALLYRLLRARFGPATPVRGSEEFLHLHQSAPAKMRFVEPVDVVWN
jgi:hypothetical protein